MKSIRVLLAAVAAAIPALAVGQSAAPASNPADPQAGTTPTRYESAFSNYRPYSEPEVANWREINDQVRAAAGQSGHAGHGTPAEAVGANAAQSARMPAAGGDHGSHGGHSGHSGHGASSPRNR